MREDFESSSQNQPERIENTANAQSEAVGSLDGFNAARDAMKGADTATVPPLELYDSQTGKVPSGGQGGEGQAAAGGDKASSKAEDLTSSLAGSGKPAEPEQAKPSNTEKATVKALAYAAVEGASRLAGVGLGGFGGAMAKGALEAHYNWAKMSPAQRDSQIANQRQELQLDRPTRLASQRPQW